MTDQPRPAFLITIDTEGDDLWSRPRKVETKNADYLPRFQCLCEKYGLKPTYLTNWEMAHSPSFQSMAKDALARETAEVGMHLHAWDSPPLVPLTSDDASCQPYLVEFPARQIAAKVRAITGVLEDEFGTKMVSHRAGRWAFNEVYARILVDQGYQADCSVTPHVSWSQQLGDPAGHGGTDYTGFPEDPYFLDLTNIARRGQSPLLEIPVTIIPKSVNSIARPLRAGLGRSKVGRRIGNHFFSPRWLRPRGENVGDMLDILRVARSRKSGYVEFMLHSSELMPGGSPRFPSAVSVERLYRHLEVLFETASKYFSGQTLAEFRQNYEPSEI